MPELPEVENVKQHLSKNITNSKILDYTQNRDDLRYVIQKTIYQDIVGQVITKVSRRGKYIITHLDNEKILLIHLGMSGRLLLQTNPLYSISKHDHIIITLTGKRSIIFNDPRRFGMVYCFDYNTLYEQKCMQSLGCEPLTENFSAEYLYDNTRKKQQAIKKVIMDNRLVVGIGNIYASEILFRARICPYRPAKDLTLIEYDRICKSTKNILTDAIRYGGTTIKDYKNSNNNFGSYQYHLQVYGRDGSKCFSCLSNISASIQGGRKTYHCRNCQGKGIS